MSTLKRKIVILNNIPTIIQKEMNENEFFREQQFEKSGLFKYRDVKEAILEFEKELFIIKHLNRYAYLSIKKKYDTIFGDFKNREIK